MTSSNGNIFRVTGPLCGEFTGPGEFPTQRPVVRSFDVFFDLRLNTRLSKQPWDLWFETPSWSLWRQCNALRYWFWFCSPGFFQFLILINLSLYYHRLWTVWAKRLFHGATFSWCDPLHLPPMCLLFGAIYWSRRPRVFRSLTSLLFIMYHFTITYGHEVVVIFAKINGFKCTNSM